MKILHVITNATFNIYYRTVSDFINLFKDNNIDQSIIYDEGDLSKFFDTIQSINIPFTKNIFGFSMKLNFAINKIAPDIIMTWGYPAREFINNTKYQHVSFVESISQMESFSVCDYIFTNSDTILSFVRTNKWSGKRSFYVPQFILEKDSKKIQKKDLYIPEHSKVIFSSAGFYNAINVQPLFSAVSLIPELYLILLGHGPNMKDIRDIATKIGVKPRVRIIDSFENIDSLISMSEFSIFPFFDIEIQKSILASFKNKKLVIADKNYLTTEIIKDKENGIILHSNNYINISDVIQKNLTDKSSYNDLIDQAYKEYINKYDKNKAIKQVIDILSQIISDNNQEIKL